MERCCCLVAEVAVALAGLGAAALAAGLGGRVVDVARGGADEPDHLAREVHPQEEVAAELLHQEGLLLGVWAVAEHLELGGLWQLLAAVEGMPPTAEKGARAEDVEEDSALKKSEQIGRGVSITEYCWAWPEG